jgi:hypothetical protein
MTIQVTSNDAPEQVAKPVEAAKEETKSAPVADQATEQNESTVSDAEETEAKEESKDESEDEAGDESAESEGNAKDKPKKKGGFQRRIDKLNAAKADAQREVEYWKRLALETQAKDEPKKDEPKVETKQASQEGKPTPEMFETHVEYVEALTDWKLEQRDKSNRAKAEESKTLAEHESALNAHYAREKSFAEKTEDYAEVLEDAGGFKDASPTLSSLIVSSENGPELMYELAKNKAEYERINKLGPVAAAREFGRFELKFIKASEEQKPEPKKTTKAPKPIEPVGGSKGTVAKSIHDPNISQREYEQLRRAEIKRRYG